MLRIPIRLLVRKFFIYQSLRLLYGRILLAEPFSTLTRFRSLEILVNRCNSQQSTHVWLLRNSFSCLRTRVPQRPFQGCADCIPFRAIDRVNLRQNADSSDGNQHQVRSEASCAAVRTASIIPDGLAGVAGFQARSKAVPCVGLVRMIGRPSVILIAESKPTSFIGI